MKLPTGLEQKNKTYYLGGCSLKELKEKYGTPLLVMDEETIREKCREYLETVRKYYRGSRVFYASKAFLNLGLARIIEEEGLGLDVVSGGELYVALQADFPPERIIMHGNNKSEKEIADAIRAGIRAIVIDNFSELEMVEELAGFYRKKIPVMLRVVPALEALTHPHLQTGMGSKFGFKIHQGQADKALKKIKTMENLKILGLHCHMGSQISEEKVYLDAARELIELGARHRDVFRKSFSLNLGGGFAVSFGEGEKSFLFGRMLEDLVPQIERLTREFDLPLPELEFEPGRSITGPAGITLYTLGEGKKVEGLGKMVPADGGMADNIRPALYGAEYDAFIAYPITDRPKEIVTITGKLCESGDIIIQNIELPSPQKGDLLAVTCTGAYTYAMSSNYNGLPRPPVVLVNRGKSEILIRGESFKDLIRGHKIPSHLRKKENKS